jgi:transcription elongation factor GreA-like protein
MEKRLNEAVDNFRAEMQFHLETFDQSHNDEYLTKDDLEQISRQVFYCLSDFKNIITEYLKNN